MLKARSTRLPARLAATMPCPVDRQVAAAVLVMAIFAMNSTRQESSSQLLQPEQSLSTAVPLYLPKVHGRHTVAESRSAYNSSIRISSAVRNNVHESNHHNLPWMRRRYHSRPTRWHASTSKTYRLLFQRAARLCATLEATNGESAITGTRIAKRRCKSLEFGA